MHVWQTEFQGLTVNVNANANLLSIHYAFIMPLVDSRQNMYSCHIYRMHMECDHVIITRCFKYICLYLRPC
jgi:hypothetical protein